MNTVEIEIMPLTALIEMSIYRLKKYPNTPTKGQPHNVPKPMAEINI